MIQPIPIQNVRWTGGFWAQRVETNRKTTLPALFKQLEKAGNIRNLELAAAGKKEGYSGPLYMDSDLYKAMEASAYALIHHPKDPLRKQLDSIITTLAKAQMPDGYLNSFYQVSQPGKRWTNLRDAHEIYCGGHMVEAAVAYYEATGETSFLEIARRWSDHIDSMFGDGAGKRIGYCGHPEAEIAFMKLYHATKEKRYLELARHMVEKRGSKIFASEHGVQLEHYDGTYWQDNVPIRHHTTAVGHAVRFAYLIAGALDLAMETQDHNLLEAARLMWHNTVNKRAYITGGIGNSAHNEGFTADYDLPNLSAYQETCASIALFLWSHRLTMMTGEGQFADAMELALYNGILSGINLRGDLFFYVNPLASRGEHHRREWYACACCPPNIGRLIASLNQYVAGVSEQAVWIHHYGSCVIEAQVAGALARWTMESDYPWREKVLLRVESDLPRAYELRLRAPGWCPKPSVKVNGSAVRALLERGYLVIKREWRDGDQVELTLPMPVTKREARPEVAADQGRIALQRGPMVYCLEERDQRAPLERIRLPLNAKLEPKWEPHLLGGVVTLSGEGRVSAEWKGDALYRNAEPLRPTPVKAIPYYAWDNRQACPMEVWILGV